MRLSRFFSHISITTYTRTPPPTLADGKSRSQYRVFNDILILL